MAVAKRRRNFVRVLNPSKRRMRRLVRVLNPAQPHGVERLFEEFKGRPAISIRLFEAAPKTPTVLAQLGGLVEVELESGRVLEFDPVIHKLCADEDENLYIVGQPYRILGKSVPGRTYDLGPVVSVTYHSIKKHIDDGAPTDWQHFFGDEGGELPTLLYQDGFFTFQDGDYGVTRLGVVN